MAHPATGIYQPKREKQPGPIGISMCSKLDAFVETASSEWLISDLKTISPLPAIVTVILG